MIKTYLEEHLRRKTEGADLEIEALE